MATKFESIYEKFLLQVDDYELGIIQDLELNNICFGYLDRARALHFPQCSKDLDDVTIRRIKYVNGERVEPVVEDAAESPKEPLEGVEEPVTDEVAQDEVSVIGEENVDVEQFEDDVIVVVEGEFNQTLTNKEQQILALGMKKTWLSSKKFSADLMSKDIGDRDYKAVQGFNYIKELRALDSELEEEIRKYGVEYTYSIEELSTGW